MAKNTWSLYYITFPTRSLQTHVYIAEGKNIPRTNSILVSANLKSLLRIKSILANPKASSTLTILKTTRAESPILRYGYR